MKIFHTSFKWKYNLSHDIVIASVLRNKSAVTKKRVSNQIYYDRIITIMKFKVAEKSEFC